MAPKNKKINVLFIIKPERAAGAEMVLLEAAARLDRERFRVFAGLLTPDRENLLPPHLTLIDFNLPGLNGWVWLRFFVHLCWLLRQIPDRDNPHQQLRAGQLRPPGRGGSKGAGDHRPLARL